MNNKKRLKLYEKKNYTRQDTNESERKKVYKIVISDSSIYNCNFELENYFLLFVK